MMTRILFLASVATFSSFAFAITSTSSSGKKASSSSLSSYGNAGQYALGLMGGIVNSSQDDLNELITRANKRAGGISTKQMTQAYELDAFFEYRFDGTIYALQFRPGYFYQVNNGMAGGTDYDYAVRGVLAFPLLRLYPLENDIMKFYLQVGVGYGQMYGEIHEDGAMTQFQSGAFGSMIGMGAQFYLTNNSCIAFEGNYRYLQLERSTVTGSSGSFQSGSLSQYGNGQELEIDSHDLSARLGGLVMLVGYSYWF